MVLNAQCSKGGNLIRIKMSDIHDELQRLGEAVKNPWGMGLDNALALFIEQLRPKLPSGFEITVKGAIPSTFAVGGPLSKRQIKALKREGVAAHAYERSEQPVLIETPTEYHIIFRSTD